MLTCIISGLMILFVRTTVLKVNISVYNIPILITKPNVLSVCKDVLSVKIMMIIAPHVWANHMTS